ncbi:MAG: hypothetical protein LBD64_08230, partial [Odoribacteraceae bacterium]|nr:hypothetical protein [Odoribacteraceae bacterium]
MRPYLSLPLFLLATGCLPEENLPARATGNAPGDYFIECYCRPGNAIRLSATRVLPLDAALDLDLDVALDVAVITGDTIPLHFFPFQGSGGFPYNYSSR